MSNKHLLKHAAIHCLLTGIILAFGNEISFVQANLTAPGSTVIDHQTPTNDTATLKPSPFHGAAPIDTGAKELSAATEIAVGILLILLGFLLHSYLKVNSDERPVRITAVESRRTVPLRTSRKERWYWV